MKDLIAFLVKFFAKKFGWRHTIELVVFVLAIIGAV
jgi:hypothetical protein